MFTPTVPPHTHTHTVQEYEELLWIFNRELLPAKHKVQQELLSKVNIKEETSSKVMKADAAVEAKVVTKETEAKGKQPKVKAQFCQVPRLRQNANASLPPPPYTAAAAL